MGTPSPKPLRFIAIAPESRKLGSDGRRSGRFRPLSRRSGRIPALPYPPLRWFQPISSMRTPFCMYYGPELTSRHYLAWFIEQKIAAIHIQLGRPMQNGHVESFHGRLRDECLNVNWFLNLWDARRKIAAWRIHYNTDRIRGWDTGRRRSSHRPWPLRRP
jgi:hypothetical protein